MQNDYFSDIENYNGHNGSYINGNPYNETPLPRKSQKVALLLSVFLGMFGAHRFYTGKIGTGILWFFTVGLFGVGVVMDIIAICKGTFRDKHGNELRRDAAPTLKVLKIAVLIWVVLYVIAFISANLGDSSARDTSIAVPKTNTDYDVYTDYSKVEKELTDLGFTNIETVAQYDIFWGITERGEVASVSINGTTDYKSGDKFEKDTPIIITYHMDISDNPDIVEDEQVENTEKPEIDDGNTLDDIVKPNATDESNNNTSEETEQSRAEAEKEAAYNAMAAELEKHLDKLDYAVFAQYEVNVEYYAAIEASSMENANPTTAAKVLKNTAIKDCDDLYIEMLEYAKTVEIDEAKELFDLYNEQLATYREALHAVYNYLMTQEESYYNTFDYKCELAMEQLEEFDGRFNEIKDKYGI